MERLDPCKNGDELRNWKDRQKDQHSLRRLQMGGVGRGEQEGVGGLGNGEDDDGDGTEHYKVVPVELDRDEHIEDNIAY